MKFEAIKAFRAKLVANEPLAGLWVTLEAPSVTEAAVAFGLDYVVVDAEHGHFDWGAVAGMVSQCLFPSHYACTSCLSERARVIHDSGRRTQCLVHLAKTLVTQVSHKCFGARGQVLEQ